MKQSKGNLVLVLVASMLLVGCGGGSEASSSSSSSSAISSSSSSLSSSSLPSSSSSSSSSVGTSSSSSSSSAWGHQITTEDTAALGSLEALKATLNSYTASIPSLTQMVYSSSRKSKNSEVLTESTASFGASSFKNLITETNKTSATPVITNKTNYEGIVDSVYYRLSMGGEYPSYNRSKVVTTVEATDQITEKEASSNIVSTQSNIITSSMVIDEIVKKSITTTGEFSMKVAGEDRDTLRTSFVGYIDSSRASYEYIANFDLSYKPLSGTITKVSYSYGDWDATTHGPVSGATASMTEKASIASISYGEQTSEVALPLTKAEEEATWVSSLSDVEITSKTGVTSVYTSANKPEAGRDLYLNDPASSDTPFSYLPATAEDVESVTFMGSSDSSIVSVDSSGKATAASDAEGKSCTLTVGNSFYSVEVEITIAANSDPNLPLWIETKGTESCFTVVDSTKGSVSYIPYNDTITLNVLNEAVLIKGKTTNEGPFTSGLSMGEGEIDSSTLVIDLLSDQSSYLDTYGKDGVYFTVELLKDPAETIYFGLTYQGTGDYGAGISTQYLSFAIDLAS